MEKKNDTKIYFSAMIAFLLAFAYYWIYRFGDHSFYGRYIAQINYSFGYAPHQYRMLIYWLVFIIDKIISLILNIFFDFSEYYEILKILFIHKILLILITWICLILIYKYFSIWFSSSLSIIGMSLIGFILIIGESWGVTYANASHAQSYISGEDVLNLLFITLSFKSIYEKQTKYLFVIIPIATLNRGTIAIIIPFYLLYNLFLLKQENKTLKEYFKPLLYTLLMVVEFFTIYFLLRILIGDLPYWGDLIRIQQNLQTFSEWWIIHGILIFPFLFYIAIFGLHEDLKVFHKLSLLIPIPFYILHFTIAMMREVRLFIPLYLIYIPFILFSFQNNQIYTPNTFKLLKKFNIPVPKHKKIFILICVTFLGWIVILILMNIYGKAELTNI